MRSKLYVVVIVILSLGLVAGCSALEQEKTAAEVVARDYFEAIRAREFEKALTFYSPQFFEKTSREQALRALKGFNAKLGDLREYKLVEWLIRTDVTTKESGTTWVMRYRVIYSEGVTEEIMTMFRASSNGQIKIRGHNINPLGLAK